MGPGLVLRKVYQVIILSRINYFDSLTYVETSKL